MRDETEIGRIESIARPKENADAQIEIRGRPFEGRSHVTGKSHWNCRESRWVLHSEGRELHGAIWESGKTWLTEAEERVEQLRLRRSTLAA
jgi:hypothetical protein